VLRGSETVVCLVVGLAAAFALFAYGHWVGGVYVLVELFFILVVLL
jgi:hypothetical protein